MLFSAADVEIPLGMVRAEVIEAGSVGHGRGDGADARVAVGEIDERVSEDLGVGELTSRLGLASLGIVGAKAMKFLLAIEGGLKAAALLGQHMQQDWAILGFEELEGLHQQGQVVSIDGAKVLQAELLEED